ncbi:MAG: prepilin-type N-terminal cleavage/methylation domain-containing protein [Planctomycetota bacterium]
MKRSGLTLLELVVVLAILAATATAAAVATERILAQRRAEITTQTLDAFRRSVLGRFGRVETVPGITTNLDAPSGNGFIADMGHFPIATGSDASTQLSELWVQPAGVSPFGLKTAPGDPDVTLMCGWRGPYLDLPLDAVRLRDGYGRDLRVLSSDMSGSPIDAIDGAPVHGITSLGSDGEIGIVNSERPLAGDTTAWLGPPNRFHLENISVTVVESDGAGGTTPPSQTGSVLVRIYLPDGATGDVTFRQSSLFATSASAGNASFVFADVPIGPKVLRAYWVSGDASQSVTSAVTTIDISRGGKTDFTLRLPPLPAGP